MKFQVEFKSNKSHWYTMVMKERTIGLDLVDRARHVLHAPYLDIDDIDDEVTTVVADPIIDISEDLARKSCRFRSSSRITVLVPEKSLSGFSSLSLQHKRNYKTDKVESAWYEWDVEEDVIISAWEEDGFPLEWDPPIDYI